jgi:hypothetical protein
MPILHYPLFTVRPRKDFPQTRITLNHTGRIFTRTQVHNCSLFPIAEGVTTTADREAQLSQSPITLWQNYPIYQIPRGIVHMHSIRLYTSVALIVFVSACSSVYYDTMEKVGIHKRDIMVDRVESARDAQAEAQEQFQSALDQFASVINLEESDLKRAYDSLNHEFEACESAAEEVSERIGKVESVAEDLFEEWQKELELYENKSLKATSAQKLKQTRQRYQTMLSSMKKAEKSMQPVLNNFRDNVLFLKHNLNAQAIGSLRGEFGNLKADINNLINRMNQSIKQSDEFIRGMQSS